MRYNEIIKEQTSAGNIATLAQALPVIIRRPGPETLINDPVTKRSQENARNTLKKRRKKWKNDK